MVIRVFYADIISHLPLPLLHVVTCTVRNIIFGFSLVKIWDYLLLTENKYLFYSDHIYFILHIISFYSFLLYPMYKDRRSHSLFQFLLWSDVAGMSAFLLSAVGSTGMESGVALSADHLVTVIFLSEHSK